MKIAKFKLEEWMNKYEASARYDLSGTCIKPLSISELCKISDTDLGEIENIPLDYGEITGSLRLKNAVKSLYQTISGDNITITHGAIGANKLVFSSLIEKGDEVVCVLPAYQQHYSIPDSFGAKVKPLFLKEENNWLPDLNEMSQLVNKKTKLICINNPNNPTGSVIPDEMLKNIVHIARKNNSWLLCDEVYRGLNLYGNLYSVSCADIYEKGISTGSMSKTYSLPGLRTGWVAAPKKLIKEINGHRQYDTISVSIIDDFLASAALENRDKIEKRNRIILKNGLDILSKWCENEPKISFIPPKGGTTVLLKYNFDMPSRTFCRKLQEKTGAALLPAQTMEMEGYLRASFAVDENVLKEALKCISAFLKEL